jgi:DinB superfamily
VIWAVLHHRAGNRRSILASMAISWNSQHHAQLDWHWRTQLRPRLDGLTDEEYFWEPVPGCWSVRKRGEGSAPARLGAGEYLIDLAGHDLDPPPVTTIAWRLAHIMVGCFVMRLDNEEFGGPQAYRNSYRAGYDAFTYAPTASAALVQLDALYLRWSEAVFLAGEDGLERPGEFPDEPLSTVILHINRETIHHGAEIALLRDLYRAKFSAA